MKQKFIHLLNQTNEFESESYRYIKSNLGQKNISLEKKLFLKSIPKNGINSICDIGCGNGENLRFWKSYFNCKKGVGVEPSKKGIKILKKNFLHEKKIDTVFGIIGSANAYIFDSIVKKGYTIHY